MTSMCSNGQYAAFSVNKMHISKNYIHFPIKSTPTAHNSKKITSQKKYNKKLRFSVNTSLFWSTKWKGNSSLWPSGRVVMITDTDILPTPCHTHIDLCTCFRWILRDTVSDMYRVILLIACIMSTSLVIKLF